MSDIARQISAGLRCDSKKSKALQKSHRAPQKTARMTPWQNEFHWRPPQKNIFVMRARAILGSFRSCARRRFLLWRWVKSALPPQELCPPPSIAPLPSVERCLPPITPDERPRSSCRACQNGRRGPRIIRRNARNARARSHAAAATVCCRFPRSVRSLALQSRLPVYKPLPINSAGDRVADCLTRFRSMPVGETSATSTCAPA